MYPHPHDIYDHRFCRRFKINSALKKILGTLTVGLRPSWGHSCGKNSIRPHFGFTGKHGLASSLLIMAVLFSIVCSVVCSLSSFADFFFSLLLSLSSSARLLVFASSSSNAVSPPTSQSEQKTNSVCVDQMSVSLQRMRARCVAQWAIWGDVF